MKRSFNAALPSIDSLIVFEQAAELESFTKAGAQLGLTQSAVSRHVIDLEVLLQAKLFDRVRQRLKLTDAGREFRERVTPIIQDLRSATLRMQMSEDRSHILNISIAASLCNLWFIPNLPAYYATHDPAQVNVMPHVGAVSFDDGRFDAAIVNSEVAPGNCESIRLCDIEVAPYASKSLLARLGATRLCDLPSIPAIELRETRGGWPRYLAHVGLPEIPLAYVGSHSLFLLSFELAVAGLGIPLLPPEFVGAGKSAGSLVCLHEKTMPVGRAYFFCWPRGSRKTAALHKLCEWLQAEMARSRQAVGPGPG